MLTNQQMMGKYGEPGDPDNFTVITLPYRMRIAWAPEKTTDRMQCHKLVADNFLSVFNDLVAHYGYERLKQLGIDLFGGCVNFRPMRGTEKKYKAAVASGNSELAAKYLSKHSWGTALDLDPARNTLKENHTTARFARSEYKPMIAVFYKHGFEGLGPEEDRDWMHFQIAE